MIIIKSKWSLFTSIFQIIVGLAAIISFFVVVFGSGEPIIKWALTLILAIAFFVMGAKGLIEYVKK